MVHVRLRSLGRHIGHSGFPEYEKSTSEIRRSELHAVHSLHIMYPMAHKICPALNVRVSCCEYTANKKSHFKKFTNYIEYSDKIIRSWHEFFFSRISHKLRLVNHKFRCSPNRDITAVNFHTYES